MTCGPAQYGELGRAMLSCATLRDSIHLTVRYYGLISRVMTLSLEEHKGVAELCWRPVLGLPFDMLMSCFDFVLGAFYNRLVLIFGDDMPDLEVAFSTVAPADTSRYRKVRGGRFYFGQGGLPAMRLRLASEHLDVPMPLANPLLLQQAEERVAVFHKLRPAPQRDWQAWAAMMVREAVEHQPTLEELATMSHVSASTLTRHLSAQGCNFRKMSSEIRHERARAMLQHPGTRVGDVAHILGYTTLGNFIRAFKAIEGVSPSQFAEQVLSTGQTTP
jgi:AraC-like DNA-binding protein